MLIPTWVWFVCCLLCFNIWYCLLVLVEVFVHLLGLHFGYVVCWDCCFFVFRCCDFGGMIDNILRVDLFNSRFA